MLKKRLRQSSLFVALLLILLSVFSSCQNQIVVTYPEGSKTIIENDTDTDTDSDSDSDSDSDTDTDTDTDVDDFISLNPLFNGVEIDSDAAFVYDASINKIVYLKGDLDEKLFPASITKLFTAYVALQNASPDYVITAGNEVNFIKKGSSIAYIKKGHKLSVTMLIEAMMLPSGNDAAYVLAKGVGLIISGKNNLSEEDAVKAFVAEMNLVASKLGLTGSNFTSPDGYHDENHYTSIRDICKIAVLAQNNEVISQYFTLATASVRYASGHTNTWTNTNLLVNPDSYFYCPDALGMKTGHTDEAGYCLMSSVKHESSYLIIGNFGASTSDKRFFDATTLIKVLHPFKS